jgi:hypothetical protein
VDREGEAITATAILDNVDNGTLSAFPDGSFMYTPNPGFIGPDQFSYDARDASLNVGGGAVVTIAMLDPDEAGASAITTVDGSGIVFGNASLPSIATPLGTGAVTLERPALSPSMPLLPSADRGEPLRLGSPGTAELEAPARFRIDPDVFAAGKRPLPVVRDR